MKLYHACFTDFHSTPPDLACKSPGDSPRVSELVH